MKRMLAVAGVATAMVVTGCSQPASEDKAAPAEAVATDAAAMAPAAAAAASPAPAASAAVPAAAGAPEFAVIYPGGTPKAPATVGLNSPAGPGGMIDYITDASPEQVVAFYRQRAEAAGMKTINVLNRDGVRGYAAGDGAAGAGKMLSVVATPLEGGGSDVHIDWSNGR